MSQMGQNPFLNYPFLQYLLSGGAMGPGTAGGYNPFFNLYAPAPPGTSQTTTYPSPMGGPGAVPPPLVPPPSSATVTPSMLAAGASPIGQIPPMPAGTVASGQNQQALFGGAVNPAAVPPFVATTPPAPNALGPAAAPPPTGSTGTGGAQPVAGQPATWMWQPGFGGGQFIMNGRAGTPQAGDMIQIPGGPLMPYSQFLQTYGPPAVGGQGGRDLGAPNLGGTIGGGGQAIGGGQLSGGRMGPGGLGAADIAGGANIGNAPGSGAYP